MKKGIIALLVVLAILVLVSPGLVGMLAEKSVDQQLEWAEVERGDIVITSERFDRGWFSSEGRHRIELRDSANADGVRELLDLDYGEAIPALIVDTKLNHGLIPISAVGEAGASLSPGLGSAVSTLSLEMADGETVELPGVIHSEIGLAGGLTSTYSAAAGTSDFGSWGPVRVSFSSDVSDSHYQYDGSLESAALLGDVGSDGVMVENVIFDGDLVNSEFGFAVGDTSFSAESVTIDAGNGVQNIGPVSATANSSIDDGVFAGELEFLMLVGDIPGVGSIDVKTDIGVSNVDARALGRTILRLQESQAGADPMSLASEIEEELLDLLAAGADIEVRRLDIEFMDGFINSAMNFNIRESDRDNFEFMSLALATEADAKVTLSESLANAAMMMSPQSAMLQGFLQKNGDVYEMEAAYKKGLLTVNGVPMPLPVR